MKVLDEFLYFHGKLFHFDFYYWKLLVNLLIFLKFGQFSQEIEGMGSDLILNTTLKTSDDFWTSQ
jgi:hypothetical protein